MPDLKKKGNSFLVTSNPDSSVYSTPIEQNWMADLGYRVLSKVLHCRNFTQTALELRIRESGPSESGFRKSLFVPFSK